MSVHATEYLCTQCMCMCVGTSTQAREELEPPVAPEVSTPTEDQPPTEKVQENNNPAIGEL